MFNEIEGSFVKNNVEPRLRSINFETLISFNNDLDRESNKAITNAVTHFLGSISAKI